MKQKEDVFATDGWGLIWFVGLSFLASLSLLIFGLVVMNEALQSGFVQPTSIISFYVCVCGYLISFW